MPKYKKIKDLSAEKNAQEIQNEIFRKLPPAKKLKLASDFSMFIMRSRNIADSNGISRINSKNSKNI